MELFTFARSDRLPYNSNLLMDRPRDDRIARFRQCTPLSVVVSARACQWAATKSAWKSISSPTRMMTKRRHGGC
eukprot:scaffold47696_cov72-Phaeocystis_antarctica.AAC.5